MDIPVNNSPKCSQQNLKDKILKQIRLDNEGFKRDVLNRVSSIAIQNYHHRRYLEYLASEYYEEGWSLQSYYTYKARDKYWFSGLADAVNREISVSLENKNLAYSFVELIVGAAFTYLKYGTCGEWCNRFSLEYMSETQNQEISLIGVVNQHNARDNHNFILLGKVNRTSLSLNEFISQNSNCEIVDPFFEQEANSSGITTRSLLENFCKKNNITHVDDVLSYSDHQQEISYNKFKPLDVAKVYAIKFVNDGFYPLQYGSIAP